MKNVGSGGLVKSYSFYRLVEPQKTPFDFISVGDFAKLQEKALKDAREILNNQTPVSLSLLEGREATDDKIALPSGVKMAELFKEGIEVSRKLGMTTDWVPHSFLAAELAAKIAEKMGINPIEAYTIALLHDIGKQSNLCQPRLPHAFEGWLILVKEFPGVARYCISHCFGNEKDVNKDSDFASFPPKDAKLLKTLIQNILSKGYSIMDLVIQYADALSTHEGYVSSLKEKLEKQIARFPEIAGEIQEVFKILGGIGITLGKEMQMQENKKHIILYPQSALIPIVNRLHYSKRA